jgi:hypothetical protein
VRKDDERVHEELDLLLVSHDVQTKVRRDIRSIQSLDHCMSFWHVLEWLQESFLTRGTIVYC